MSGGDLKKKYLSDYEDDFSRYILENTKKLKKKLENLPHPIYPYSMKDVRLFQKFSIEYIKNIILNGYKCTFYENISFNFLYISLFLLKMSIQSYKVNYLLN